MFKAIGNVFLEGWDGRWKDVVDANGNVLWHLDTPFVLSEVVPATVASDVRSAYTLGREWNAGMERKRMKLDHEEAVAERALREEEYWTTRGVSSTNRGISSRLH
jgi:hypothetical protein